VHTTPDSGRSSLFPDDNERQIRLEVEGMSFAQGNATRRIAGLLLLGILLAGLLVPGPVAAAEKVTMSALWDHEALVPGGSARLAVKFAIAKGYHLFHHAYTFEEDFTIPVSVSVTAPEGVTLRGPRWTRALVVDDAGEKVREYKGDVYALFEVVAGDSLSPGEAVFTIDYGYQSCSDLTGTCYPPVNGKLEARIPVLAAGVEPAAKNAAVFAEIVRRLEPAGGDAGAAGGSEAVEPGDPGEPAAAAEPDAGGESPDAADAAGSETATTAGESSELQPAAQSEPTEEKSTLRRLLDRDAWFLALLFMYVAGLGAFLLPCVYPMVPITIAYFARQSEGKLSKSILRALAYVFGISISYSILGLVAGFAGQTFGALATHPVVLVPLVIILVAMGLSFMGLFEFRLPSFLTARASGGARTGYLGAVMMGFFLGIVAAPCVGPPVIMLLTIVLQSGNVAFGFFGLMAFAWGLGTPFIFLAVFSDRLSALPRSGPWMEAVRKVFAFVIFGVALFFADQLVHWEPFTPLAWGAFLLLSAPFFGVGKPLEPSAGNLRSAAKGLGYVLAVAGAALLLTGLTQWGAVTLPAMGPALSGPGPAAGAAQAHAIPWRAYETGIPDPLELARSEGKPVFIDFWASWCKNCKYMLATTFKDPQVVEAMKGYIPLKLRAEDASTEGEKVHRRLLEIMHGGKPTPIGYPSYFIISSQGKILWQSNGVFKPDALIEILDRYRR
jgi:thiol:disulfide interchange protein DsbD